MLRFMYSMLFVAVAIMLAAFYYARWASATDQLRASAALGDASSQYSLARKLSRGEGIAEDQEAALAWFRKAAENGDAKAQLTMARLYFSGDGVAKDPMRATIWLKRAADSGDSFAQGLMGMASLGGIGVAQDPYAALAWFNKSQEPEAKQLAHVLQEDLEKIEAKPEGEREQEMAIFKSQKQIFIQTVFSKLMLRMKRHENRREYLDGN
ncbi:MAG: tetratricopeptide repeat protein [bacterium]|nr:tetratricopeptide repeat protein [bacterium]